MEPLAPALQALARSTAGTPPSWTSTSSTPGGPRILDDLCTFLEVAPEAFRFSRATLTEYGNIASAVVLDALRRLFDEGGPTTGTRTARRLRAGDHRRDGAGPLAPIRRRNGMT